MFRFKGLFVLTVWSAFGGLAWSQASGPSSMDATLAASTERLVQKLVDRNAAGREYTVAVVTFSESGARRQRKLGAAAAEAAARHLAGKHPAWLKVLERGRLSAVLEEQKLWVTKLLGQKGSMSAGEAPFPDSADFLIVGSYVLDGKRVELETRLVASKTGSIAAAEKCQFTLPEDMAKGLVAWVERSSNGTADDSVTAVSAIRLTVIAQRADASGGIDKEWTIKEGETLRGGDRFDLRFSVDADASVYVFLYGSDRKTSVLFPTDDWEEQYARRFGRQARPQDNYCRADWEYWAPGPDAEGKQRFFQLDDTTGQNYLYVAAKRANLKNVEDVRQRLQDAKSQEERLDLLQNKAGVDAVKSFTFNQQ